MATYSSHRLIMGKEEIDNFFCLIWDIWIFLQKLGKHAKDIRFYKKIVFFILVGEELWMLWQLIVPIDL